MYWLANSLNTSVGLSL